MNRVLPIVAMAMLSACTTPVSRHPSLLPREIEKRAYESEPVRPPVTAAPDAALDARIAEMDVMLGRSAAAFPEALDRASRDTAAASASTVGSDAWLSAQAALADLDAIRAADLSLLAEMDRIAIDRGAAGLPPYPALAVLRDRAEAQTNAEVSAGEQLQAKLPQQ